MGGHVRRAAGPGPIRRAAKGKGDVQELFLNMLDDNKHVRAALRANAQPQLVCGRDSLTKRVLRPDTIAYGPDGDVLILVRFGRVTMLGRLWDEQSAERTRSRSPCVIPLEEPVPAESKWG